METARDLWEHQTDSSRIPETEGCVLCGQYPEPSQRIAGSAFGTGGAAGGHVAE